jgi:hypothetical protein
MTTIPVTFDDAKAEALRAEAARRNITVEEFVREQAERAVQSASTLSKKKNTLSRALGLAKTDKPAPTDQEVKQILTDERIRKYGG